MTHTPDWPLLWIKRDGETRTIMQDRFEIARMNPRGDFPDDIEEWQAMRAVTAVNSFEAMRAALTKAEEFITNGIELGFIRMPEPDTPDSAHETLPAIRAALAKAEAQS